MEGESAPSLQNTHSAPSLTLRRQPGEDVGFAITNDLAVVTKAINKKLRAIEGILKVSNEQQPVT